MPLTQNPPKESEGLTFISVLDAICDRRAIRHFTSQAVDKSTVKILLNYAAQAPSATNSQPWSFVVVQNARLLKEISDEAKKLLLTDPRRSSEAGHGRDRFLNPDFNIFYDAATLIVICSTKEGRIPEADCYLAAQNLMLAAHGLGLGRPSDRRHQRKAGNRPRPFSRASHRGGLRFGTGGEDLP